MDFNKNYYQILGLDKNANSDDIKKKYRKLAKEHHPDTTKNHDDSLFKELNESYSVLGDESNKQKYDTHSPHGKSYHPGNNFFRMNMNDNPFSNFAFNGFNIFDDTFFRDIFNRQEEFQEDLDIPVNIDISLKDVYNNINIPIEFSRYVKCDHCNHTGFDPKSESFDCDACDGKGHDGFTKCKYCGGTGKIHSGTCENCKGKKVTLKKEQLGFSNTYTIDKNFTKYMKGAGHQSKYYYNKVGTLIINTTYKHDDRYIRNNHDLIYILNLHYQYAIDGTTFEYEHLDDKKYSIKIPEKTKDGDLLKLSKKGLLKDGTNRGDLIIKINIIIDYEKM